MSTTTNNLPTLRKYASGTFDTAAIIDQVLDGLGSSITISSVSSSVVVRDAITDEVATDGPTITNVAKNSGVYTRPSDGEQYAANTVIQYTIAGGTKRKSYHIDFEVTPSSGSGPFIVRQPVAVE